MRARSACTAEQPGRCRCVCQRKGLATDMKTTYMKRRPSRMYMKIASARSGREDLNLRPPQPHCGALPGCATPRDASQRYHTFSVTSRSRRSWGAMGAAVIYLRGDAGRRHLRPGQPRSQWRNRRRPRQHRRRPGPRPSPRHGPALRRPLPPRLRRCWMTLYR